MGLRERKREQTKQALADAALQLFAEKGYEATTIADIAERADVSPRTFFAHHTSKEHVLFCDHDDQLDSLKAFIAQRASMGLDTLGALRGWILTLIEDIDLEEIAVHEQLKHRVIDASPELAAHERQLSAELEVVLRAGIAEDLGETPDDLRPRLVSATASAALQSTRPAEGVTYTVEGILERIDSAFTFLRGGLDALSTG